MSSLDELEAGQAVFRNHSVADDALSILKDQGLDTIRLRMFHSPSELKDSLNDMLSLARRAHDLGYKIILDLHYSDTWADPGQQTKPAAWASISLPALQDSVRVHTAQAVAALVTQGTPPIIVQIGNEITTGMLWDTGRTGGPFDTPAQWKALSRLLEAGIEGVRAESNAEVMIHIDRGGDAQGAKQFFDRLEPFELEFDLIGLSYYPWWHGSLNHLRHTVHVLRTRYQWPVMLIETAYPWTLRWNDNQHNPVGLAEHTLLGYPATPQGQADFLATLWQIVPAGVCYWAPEMIAAPGFPSSWENLALFDFEGNVLPAARVLGSGPTRVDHTPQAQSTTIEVFPNPVRLADSVVKLRVKGVECGTYYIFDALGRVVRTAQTQCADDIEISVRDLVPGVYWIRLSGSRTVPLVLLR